MSGEIYGSRGSDLDTAAKLEASVAIIDSMLNPGETLPPNEGVDGFPVAQAEPLSRPVVEELIPMSEAYFRAQKQPHRRLVRRPKPNMDGDLFAKITEILDRGDMDEYQALAPKQRIDHVCETLNGRLTERDLEALRVAEIVRLEKQLRRSERWSGQTA